MAGDRRKGEYGNRQFCKYHPYRFFLLSYKCTWSKLSLLMLQMGNTPLHTAATKGYLEIVEFLVSSGNADVNQTNQVSSLLSICTVWTDTFRVYSQIKFTCLHYACREDQDKVVRYLVETCKADVDCPDKVRLYGCSNSHPLSWVVSLYRRGKRLSLWLRAKDALNPWRYWSQSAGQMWTWQTR